MRLALVACPEAGSLEMWRWVEILASTMWSVIPGPVDLREETLDCESGPGLAWAYFTELGREILRLLKSPSDTLTVFREDRRRVQNNCRGFSLETCFSSGFTCSRYL